MANNCDMQECQQQVGATVEETIAITQRSTTDCVRIKQSRPEMLWNVFY